MTTTGEHRIGLISDTHGLLRPQAVAALSGVELLIHAGDVGDPDILGQLRSVAPLTAVRGNVDRGAWAAELPETAVVEIGTARIYVLHILDQLPFDPAEKGFDAVVYGHSHQPKVETKNGVLYVNPGSAGPRRFRLPVSVARLAVRGGELVPELVEIG